MFAYGSPQPKTQAILDFQRRLQLDMVTMFVKKLLAAHRFGGLGTVALLTTYVPVTTMPICIILSDHTGRWGAVEPTSTSLIRTCTGGWMVRPLLLEV